MKIFIQAFFIILLNFGLIINVYSCTKPSSPVNTTNSDYLIICQGQDTKLSAKGIGTLGWYSEAKGGIYLGNDTILITPNLSKTTTFYVQDSTCEASATRTAITVTVNIHAKADFIVNPICEGDSATFINLSKNAETYIWKFGDGETSTEKSPKHFYKKIFKSHPPNCTLVAIVSSGCSDSISKPVTINAYPKSDFSFTSNETVVNFKVLQSGNTSYKWVFGKIDSTLIVNPVFDFQKLGIYTVCLNVTNAAGCFSKTCKEISLTIGVHNVVKPIGFNIYPNPSRGNFSIEKETTEILRIEIFNQMGQIVHKTEMKEHLNPINVNLIDGIYFIRVTNGEKCFTQKIVVTK